MNARTHERFRRTRDVLCLLGLLSVSTASLLRAQESAAVQARYSVNGGHFDTITREETLERLLDCLQQ